MHMYKFLHLFGKIIQKVSKFFVFKIDFKI